MDALQWMGAVRMRVQTADKTSQKLHVSINYDLYTVLDLCIFLLIQTENFFMGGSTIMDYSISILARLIMKFILMMDSFLQTCSFLHHR